MKFFSFLLITAFCLPTVYGQGRSINKNYDICVYGATSGGVVAAYVAQKMGKSVLLIEPGNQVGGLTAGGLGYTDIGNKYVITGIAIDFYRRVGQHYGLFEKWIFEPHVAGNIFLNYLKSAKVHVLYERRLVSVKKNGVLIKDITVESSGHPGKHSYQVIEAKMFIDCSYEGDLMAKAGVSYATGRESNSMFNETYDGVQLREHHQFPDGIDPYVIPGDPRSGLLWGISSDSLGVPGSGDRKIQSYNFRVCLSSDPANRIQITKPKGYDSSRYELLLRYLDKKPAENLNSFLKIDLIPNRKTDVNNNGPFSTDMIGMNYAFPDADYAARLKIQQAHEAYTKGLLYFIGHDKRMPAHLRELMLQWGYPKDEYKNNRNWSPQMYVRETRRMIGEYIMTQANCEGEKVVDDGIGMAAYSMDSHNCQRIVINGMVKNEGDVEIGGFGPYPVSYRSIIPKADECRNLLVPVCLSATHIAYGSIRMEPVFMVLSQSAAVAAVLAINTKKTVQEVDVKQLQQELLEHPLADGSTPEILVDNDDTAHVAKKGNWSTVHRECYGPSAFINDGKTDSAESVRFIPSIVKAGRYKVYSYFTKRKDETSQTSISIFNGKEKHEVVVKESDITIEGQTSGKWVFLGTYAFSSGNNSYAEISNRKVDGTVVADAVLFVPVF